MFFDNNSKVDLTTAAADKMWQAKVGIIHVCIRFTWLSCQLIDSNTKAMAVKSLQWQKHVRRAYSNATLVWLWHLLLSVIIMIIH